MLRGSCGNIRTCLTISGRAAMTIAACPFLSGVNGALRRWIGVLKTSTVPTRDEDHKYPLIIRANMRPAGTTHRVRMFPKRVFSRAA